MFREIFNIMMLRVLRILKTFLREVETLELKDMRVIIKSSYVKCT